MREHTYEHTQTAIHAYKLTYANAHTRTDIYTRT